MFKEIDLFGVYVSPFVAYFAAAFAIFLALRWLLVRIGFEKLVWHAPLAEGGLFVAVLAALILYV